MTIFTDNVMVLSETCKITAWDSVPSMGTMVPILRYVLNFKYFSDLIKLKVKTKFSPA